MPHRPWRLLISAICVLLLACSCAPPVSESDKAFTDARNNLKFSDFDGALNNLDKVIKSAKAESPRQQALVLRIALVTALADANRQMAEAYYTGAQQPDAQSHSSPFYKTRADYYSTGSSLLMNAMQAVMNQRSKLGANAIPLEVAFPSFTETIPGLKKIKDGQIVSDSDRLSAELQVDRNAFAAVLSALAGAGPDPNKGKEAFSSGKVDVDPRVYLIEISSSFVKAGAMFDSSGMNQLDRLRTVKDVVKGNLDAALKLLAAKPDKDLEERVKKMQADFEKPPKKKAK
ncbi:MAG: hypothetical protein ACHQT6_12390 [Candidatus Acidiferrales bacterium]